MTPEQFCYWLQGYAELATDDSLSPQQWAVIKDHLQQVFDKKTTVTVKVDAKDAKESIKRAMIDASRQGGPLFNITRLGQRLQESDPKPTLIC